jgi:pimeloyl-ACP methyl ester carboxylesterase
MVVHGGFGLASLFGDMLDHLATGRRVVAVELQGHGHTRDIDRPFSFEEFGRQILGVAAHLGFEQLDLLGYSLGATACLHSAFQDPDRVRRLALVSIACRRDGWFPEVLAGMDRVNRSQFEQMSQWPMYAAWLAVAPDPEAFPTLMDKTGALLSQSYDWTDHNVFAAPRRPGWSTTSCPDPVRQRQPAEATNSSSIRSMAPMPMDRCPSPSSRWTDAPGTWAASH